MNTNINIDAVMKCCETNGWEVRADRQGKDVIFEFCKFTPAGQDFGFSTSMKGNCIDSLADDIEDYYEGLDPDYEASLWIGKDGHGRRGAPYHIKDIVADMEKAEEMVYRLLEAIRGIA
ncbi:hypothetical protein [Marseilla massiliensis]|uniref:Uncharacterized protein n=1 Tax=Marseilla massiliensis TaxID=1841864 RepID=A0A938WMZ3_9BACT|nr:hypothetical protein [Marseilla massiliensis]